MSTMPFRRALLCFIVASLVVCRAMSGADVIPAPLDLGKDIAAYVIAPDVNALLNNADAVVKLFAPPDQYQPGMLKMLIGSQLGDPALANLGTKPAVLMVFKLPAGYNPQGAPPPMALFISANAAAPYDQVFNQGGVTAFEDGLLMAAPTPEALKQAQGAKAAYAKIAAAGLKNDLRVYVSISSLMETFGPLVKGALVQAEHKAIGNITNTPPPPNIKIQPETAIQVVKLALRGVQGFANQADALQLDLKISPDMLIVDETFFAKDGTVLSALFSGAPGVWDKRLDALVGNGSMAGQGNMDMAAMSAGWKKLLGEIVKDPEIAGLADNEVVKTISDSVDAVGGASVFAVNVEKDGTMRVSSAGTLKDADKYSRVFDAMGVLFKADGFLANIYGTMGMKMDAKIEKGERERKGMKINRVAISIDMPMMPAAQRENMKKMMQPTEGAISKDLYLSSNNPETLDTMIDKVASGDLSPAGMTLKSKALFGEGMQMYVDYDIFAVMKAMIGNDANNPAAPVFAKLPDGEPLLVGIAVGQGRAQEKIALPLKALAKMVKEFQDMGKNIERGGPPKPKPTDDGKF